MALLNSIRLPAGETRAAQMADQGDDFRFGDYPVVVSRSGFEQHKAVPTVEQGSAGAPGADSRSVSLLEDALALNSSLPEAHHQPGTLLLEKGEVEKVPVHLDAAARLNPQNIRIHPSPANAYRRLGRDDEAAKEIRLVKSPPNREEDPN